MSNVVEGIGGGIGFGLSILKNTVGKAIPIENLEKQYFELKNGILYWYNKPKARVANGSIKVKDISLIEIDNKNRKQVKCLYQDSLYTFESVESQYNAEKWCNSLKMVKEMGDLNNLDPNRYSKLNVFTKQNGKIVFKDFEIILDQYETKVCDKIIYYKFNKIFHLQTKLLQENQSMKELTNRTSSKSRSESTKANSKQEVKTGVGSKFSKFKMFVKSKVDKKPEQSNNMGSPSERSVAKAINPNKMTEADKKKAEVRLIMRLPEVKDKLLRKANPMNFDLYKCAFEEGGELEMYAEYLHTKLL